MHSFDRHRLLAILVVGAMLVAPGLTRVVSHCHDKATPVAVSQAEPHHGSDHGAARREPGLPFSTLSTCCVDPQVPSALPALLRAQPDTRPQGAGAYMHAPRGFAPHVLAHADILRPSESPPGLPRSRTILNSVFLI